MTQIIFRQISTAFDQNLEILEMQQDSIDAFHNPPQIDITADSGGIQARRLLKSLLQEQARAEV